MGLNEIIEKAKEMVDIAGEKTSEFVGITKLKYKASQVESKIGNIYKELGQVVYESQKNNTDNSQKVKSLCNSIDLLFLELSSLREQIAVAQKQKKCSSCSKYNQENTSYCAYCGTKFE